MKYAFCSREFERDYAWEKGPASDALVRHARTLFVPAFEGVLTTSRFAVLLRHPGVSDHVVLGVSVSTTRIDFRNRPIRTMAFFEAESPEDEAALLAVFADCLARPDARTLYDAASPLAKAVERLYQTKSPEEFLAFAASLPSLSADAPALKGRAAFPREDDFARRESARSLPALARSGAPFLVAILERSPKDMLKTLDTLFSKGVLRVFSQQVTSRTSLDDGLQKHLWAAAIGTIILALLVAAATKSCFGRADRQTEPFGGPSHGSVEDHPVVP